MSFSGLPQKTSPASQRDQIAPLPPWQRDCREAFKPLADQYYRQQSLWPLALLGPLGYFGCVVLPLLSWPWIQARMPFWLNYVVFFVPTLAFLAWLRPRVPKLPNCPACGKSLGPPFGPYCPECAGPLMEEKSDWGWSRWYCSTSEKDLRAGKSRNFKYHACSHCGVILHDKGL